MSFLRFVERVHAQMLFWFYICPPVIRIYTQMNKVKESTMNRNTTSLWQLI